MQDDRVLRLRSGQVFHQLADDLLKARDTARPVTRPTDRSVGLDLDTGYQVGHILHQRLVERGYQPVGRKIGFTNPATWKEFDLQTPIWAHMYAQTVHFANQCVLRLSVRGMTMPRIEPEVVLKLSQPVPAGNLSAEELAAHIDWAAIGFEVVDCHYAGWKFAAADVVADFGLHAALVVGIPWQMKSQEREQVATQLQTLQVTLRRGEEIVAEGEGRNALGSPLLALGHLARVLAAQPWAPALAGGEIITTGTLTPLPYISSGEHWSVQVTGVPIAPLELELDDH